MRACDRSSEMMHSLSSALSYCSAPPKAIVEPQRGTLQVETKLTGENSTYQLWKLVHVSNGFQALETIKRFCLYVLHSLTSDSQVSQLFAGFRLEQSEHREAQSGPTQTACQTVQLVSYFFWSLFHFTMRTVFIQFISPVVTTVMKMTSLRHLQPSPRSAVWENLPQTAPWINRSSHQYTHR